jgi:hypothetical protein
MQAESETGGSGARTEPKSSGRKAVERNGKGQPPSRNDDRHTVCPCGVMKALTFGKEPPIADHAIRVITGAGLQR